METRGLQKLSHIGTRRLTRVGIDWLGLYDTPTINGVNRKLANQEPERHAGEKHKHLETGLGSAGQTKRSTNRGSSHEEASEEKALQWVVPPINRKSSPRRTTKRGLAGTSESIPDRPEREENHRNEYDAAENNVRICVGKSLRRHLGIAGQYRKPDQPKC
jgi:hypothetical protein